MNGARPGVFPTLRIRLDLAPGVSIGPGKAELLRGVAETGSISAAGRRIGMSYKRAWQLVDALNRHFDSPLVSATRGGARGGGAQLTPLGAQVLDMYFALEGATNASVADSLRQLAARLRVPDAVEPPLV
jgi:molybdate transport system regulatory protein